MTRGRRRQGRFVEALAPLLSGRRLRAARERLERRLGITPAGEVALALAGGLWLAARIVAGKSMYLFAYGTLLVVVGTVATGRRKLPLDGSRSEARPRVRQGEVLSIDLRLRANDRLSTIVLEEAIPDRLGEPVRLPIATLESGGEIVHTYRLFCKRRGRFTLGPLVARWGDPIGLSQREMEVAPAFDLLIHPRVEPVDNRILTRSLEDPPIRPPVSKPWPSGMEFYGMREYVPGDDLRRIVWRAVAKTGKLLVREAEQGITDQIVVILDTDARLHTPGDPSESFEEAVNVAASLGVKHLYEGFTVATYVNDGPLTRPLHGSAAQIMLLDELAGVQPSKIPLHRLVMRLTTEPRLRGSHVILITPRLQASDAGQLRMLLNKGVSVTVVALIWEPGGEETLNTAAALGCAVAELRPGQSIQSALSQQVGAGRR